MLNFNYSKTQIFIFNSQVVKQDFHLDPLSLPETDTPLLIYLILGKPGILLGRLEFSSFLFPRAMLLTQGTTSQATLLAWPVTLKAFDSAGTF